MSVNTPNTREIVSAIRNIDTDNFVWFGIVAPKMVFLVGIFVLPFAAAIVISFHEWSPIAQDAPFVGLSHYRSLMNDPLFWKAMINTIGYTIAMVAANIPLGLGVALLLDMELRGTEFYSSIIFLPVVASMAVVSLIWFFLYNPDSGFFNIILRSIGLSGLEWLKSSDTALASIFLMSLWKRIPFNMVIFLAGLQSIPDRQYEAAKIDGADVFQRFRYVTIPLLKPTLFFVIVIQTIFSFRMFGQVFVMTNGGPAQSTYTLVYYLYESGFSEFNFGYASAISVILFLMVLVISVGQNRIWSDSDAY